MNLQSHDFKIRFFVIDVVVDVILIDVDCFLPDCFTPRMIMHIQDVRILTRQIVQNNIRIKECGVKNFLKILKFYHKDFIFLFNHFPSIELYLIICPKGFIKYSNKNLVFYGHHKAFFCIFIK